MPQTQPDVETPQKPKKIDTAISPAKTEPLSPMGHTIKIEHQQDQPRGLWGIGRAKTFIICVMYLVLIGGVAYFLLEWLKIPELNEELDRFEGEVDRLEQRNNIYMEKNKQLETASKELNTSVGELTAQVNDLDMINKDLNTSVVELTAQLDDVDTKNKDLNSSVVTLTAQLDDLDTINKDLNSSIVELNTQVGKLEKINTDLKSVAGFLNDTAGQIGQTFEEISEYLANQIEANKVLVLGSIENAMKQRAVGWDCNYGNLFGSREWGTNFSADISAQDWEEVVAYVNENVLEELCLSQSDFEAFVKANSDLWPKWTSQNLIAAVAVYTTDALDWYFPEQGETGLTHADWAAASYDCQKLTTKFTYSLVSSS